MNQNKTAPFFSWFYFVSVKTCDFFSDTETYDFLCPSSITVTFWRVKWFQQLLSCTQTWPGLEGRPGKGALKSGSSWWKKNKSTFVFLIESWLKSTLKHTLKHFQLHRIKGVKYSQTHIIWSGALQPKLRTTSASSGKREEFCTRGGGGTLRHSFSRTSVPSSLVTPNLQCQMSSPLNPSLLQNRCPSNTVTHTATCTGCILIKFLMPPELAPLPPDSQTLEPSVISPGLALSHPHHGRDLSVPMCFHFPGLTSPQPGHLSPLAIHAMYISEFSIQLRKTPFKFSVAPRSELCLCSSSPIPPSITFTEGLLPWDLRGHPPSRASRPAQFLLLSLHTEREQVPSFLHVSHPCLSELAL